MLKGCSLTKSPFRILVVDDNEHNSDMLSRRLIKLGYDVDIAEDGQQALDCIPNGNFDAVLLDVMMPGISGLEVLKILRETYSLAALPIIITTIMDSSGDMVEGLDLGANDYVFKPINFPVLLARLKTHLEVKRLHEEREELLTTQREFLGIAGHDLRNPLSRIMGFAELLIMTLEEGSSISKDDVKKLNHILHSGHEMNDLIGQFVNMRAIEDGQLHVNAADMNLNDAVKTVVETSRDRADEKGIEINMEVDADLPVCQADESRISQVISNFVQNAVKFCSSGDKVVVRTRQDGDEAVLEVSDSGPGLTESDIAGCFQKHARLSNKPTDGEGTTGNGLYISRMLVEAHNGTVSVSTNLDGGASFSFRIPMAGQ